MRISSIEDLANARAIAVAAAHEFGVPLLDLDAIEIDLDVVRAVDQKLVNKHRVLPLVKRGQRLFVGIADPTNLQAIDDIKFQTSLRIDPVVVEQDKLEERIVKAIEAVDTTMGDLADDDFDLENLDVSGDEDDNEEVDSGVEDAPVVRFVNKIFCSTPSSAARLTFTSNPTKRYFRVRTRLDGVLSEVAQPPVLHWRTRSVRASKSCRVWILLNGVYRRTVVSRCGCRRIAPSTFASTPARRCSARKSYCVFWIRPVPSWESTRLATKNIRKNLYNKHLMKPYGMILVTGPTGSGKTVSLYTGLNVLNTIDRNISTAEDPAEINLPGINQVNVNPKVGLTFASSLKAFLRQDPDIIMVGEIRDLETAEIAIKAAQTGHLVLSTLHTNDAPRTLTRLVDMGVKPYAIATSVSLIIAQRLARKLCDSCKESKTFHARPSKKKASKQKTSMQWHGYLWAEGMQELQRRLQRTSRHIPGNGSVGSHGQNNNGRRQRHADRRSGGQ